MLTLCGLCKATKLGIIGVEPVPVKTHAELYTFVGRAALDKKPPLLVLGAAGEPPAWVGQLATELRKPTAAGMASGAEGGPKDPEAKTKELLREAARATKVAAVKEGVAELLAALDKKGPALGPPVVTPAYTSDPAAAEAFGLSASDLPAVLVAAIDRKTGSGSYVAWPGGAVAADKRGKVKDLAPLAAFVHSMLPACSDGPAALEAKAKADAKPLPPFPKPAAVLAAEERERKRKERDSGFASVQGGKDLVRHCYELAGGRTCALLALPGGAAAATGDKELAGIAKRFSKDGFGFAALDASAAPTEVLAALFPGVDAFPALAVVKGGKRPRVAVASGAASALATHLDDVVGGGATFAKLAGGFPTWPSDGGDSSGDDASEAISDEEL